MLPPPKIPWQLTGNHWVSIPCIHPADGSIYAVSVVQRALRGAVEFAGTSGFVHGGGDPLLRLGMAVNGTSIDWSSSPMAWQRIFEWLPTFNTTVGELAVQGTIFAPFGPGNDVPGFVYTLSFENRGTREAEIQLTPSGVLGLRQHRVITGRPCDDAHAPLVHDDTVVLTGDSPLLGTALAMTADGARAAADRNADGSVSWSLAQRLVVPPGGRAETAVYVAVGVERDGARATLDVLRRRGWRRLAEGTREALSKLQQATEIPSVDRLVNRHLMFAYFFSVARAIDDGQLYVVRTRAPWNTHGLTVRDWEALMWVIPAVQIADADLGRELLLRVCEVHGYAPGQGVNYLDGTPFCLGFSLDGACAYALAVDRYILHTGDDRIVEEPVLADTLYVSYDDIMARGHPTLPLFSTELTPSGAPAQFPYTLHANAVTAEAFDVFRRTLDEKTADKVEGGATVRAALVRHFNGAPAGADAFLVTVTDLQGATSLVDDPVGSALWLPAYETLARDDPTYRRTVARLEAAGPLIPLAVECARLVGPSAQTALDHLRRATMDNGAAAEYIGPQGDAVGNGGDAALSGLVASTVWYAVHVLGVRI